jgi:hypothetical protein
MHPASSRSPRARFPPDAAVGTVIAAQDRQGRQFPLKVIHLDDNVARLDGNLRLAGKDLVFPTTVKNVEGIKGAVRYTARWGWQRRATSVAFSPQGAPASTGLAGGSRIFQEPTSVRVRSAPRGQTEVPDGTLTEHRSWVPPSPTNFLR